jgi:hypothetical protein
MVVRRILFHDHIILHIHAHLHAIVTTILIHPHPHPITHLQIKILTDIDRSIKDSKRATIHYISLNNICVASY